jgi:hypothetical protein
LVHSIFTGEPAAGEFAVDRAEERLVEHLDPIEHRRMAAGDRELQDLLRPRAACAAECDEPGRGRRADELPTIHDVSAPSFLLAVGYATLCDGIKLGSPSGKPEFVRSHESGPD